MSKEDTYTYFFDRINRKVVKMCKNSNVMIIGELTYLETEFVVEIQDVNFLPMSIANVEAALTDGSTSPYSWPSVGQSSGRMSAQEMAKRQPTLPPPEQVTPYFHCE